MNRAPVDPITDLSRLLARINVLCDEIRRAGKRLRVEGREKKAKNTKAGAGTPAGKGEQGK